MGQTLRLRAVGDNLMHAELCKSAKQEDGSYCFDPIYEKIADVIHESDIAVINQETIFVDKAEEISSFPVFGTPREVGDAIVKAGFNVVTHASNHTMDKKIYGVDVTTKFWKENYPDVTILGICDTMKEFYHIPIVEKNGIKIAMLNFTQKLNGHSVPHSQLFRVFRLKDNWKKYIAHQIKKAKEMADLVVVFPHWGSEYMHEPVVKEVEWTKYFAEQNVDIVIGTHPHVMQPMEWVDRADGGRMLVYYSLGNLISCQTKLGSPLGGMADILIKKDETGTRVKEHELVPLVAHAAEDMSAFAVYLLKDYTPELAAANGILKQIREKKEVNIDCDYLHALYQAIIERRGSSYNEFARPRDVYMNNIKGVIWVLTGHEARR